MYLIINPGVPQTATEKEAQADIRENESEFRCKTLPANISKRVPFFMIVCRSCKIIIIKLPS